MLSSNLAEIVAMVVAVVFKIPVPLLAIHVLWINLITDSVPALALGSDFKELDIMEEKPRKKGESLFVNGGLRVTLFYGVLIGGLCLLSFLCVPLSELLRFNIKVSWSEISNLLSNDGGVLKKAQTFCFVTLATCELAHALIMRNVRKTFIRSDVFKNKIMVLSIVLGGFLQWCVVELPLLNELFKTSDLVLGEWLFAIGCALIIFVVHEVILLLKNK